MDLVLLRSFLAVADAGTITDAADRVGISQSALSRRLQQLEADLGAELLVRGRHGVELTELGRQTVEQARGIVGPLRPACVRTSATTSASSGAPSGSAVGRP